MALEMVRVVFLVSPFKKRMIKRMVDEFSPHTISEIVTPTYPSISGAETGRSFMEKVDEQFLGGTSLREAVSKLAPDIVYCDSPLYASQFKLVSLFAKKRIPLILHLRGDLWREYWAWFTLERWWKRPRGMPQYLYSWASVCSARKITPICKWLDRVVKCHVPWKKTEVVYQGVDPQEFFNEDGAELQKPAVALIQNHTIYPKVLGLLGFRRVVERLPKVHFYLTEGERIAQQFLPLVKGWFAGFENVHFLREADNAANTRKILNASDCYVLASGLDCCPTTVLEASLTCRPVIASRVGGIPEIILQGETGWTIRNDLVDEWVNKITLVLKDPRLNRRLGSRGREWVTERFSWSNIAPQVERLLKVESESV